MYRSLVTLATTEAAAIAALLSIAVDHGAVRDRASGTEKPSTRQAAPGTATRSRLRASAARLVTCRPRASIPRTQRTVTATRAAARTTAGRAPRAPPGCALLRVVQLAEGAPVAAAEGAVVDQHRRGHQRPRQRPAPGLVAARDEARPQLAVEAEQPRGAAPAARESPARAAVRGSRFGRAASR